MAAGGAHTCALRNDGTVYCWGDNWEGQLGDGTTALSRPTPVAVAGLTGATALAAGGSHTCALQSDGTVACWGDNYYGQLGDGTTTSRPTPVAVAGLSGATALAVGGSHTCALRNDGTVACWGANYYGQLGDGTFTDRLTPTAVAGLSGATAIAARGSHTCALLADGTARCWGNNEYGQLGDGTARGARPFPAPVVDPATGAAVQSIVRADPSPTSADRVRFTVTFTRLAARVTPASFALTTTGALSGVGVVSVVGGPTVYTVTVATDAGSGTLRLDVPVGSGIVDQDGNPLTGGFISGEAYEVRPPPSPTAAVNHPDGAPGSVFVFTLTGLPSGAAVTVDVRAPGQAAFTAALRGLTVGADGRLSFALRALPTAPVGVYTVRATVTLPAGAYTARASVTPPAAALAQPLILEQTVTVVSAASGGVVRDPRRMRRRCRRASCSLRAPCSSRW